MKFEKLTRETMKTNGTSLQGYLDNSYEELVAVFGFPSHDGDGYKIDVEWVLEFEDGTIATIYNWKNGYNYTGTKGWTPNDVNDWHIGGNDEKAVDRVQEVMAKAPEFTWSEFAHVRSTRY